MAGAVVVAVAAATAGVVGRDTDVPRGPTNGGWSTHCDRTGQAANVDPVVFPGIDPTPHLHEFFGALGITAYTTAADLRAAYEADPESNTCTGTGPPEDVDDPAGYWTPALYNTPDKARALHAIGMTVYWASRGADPASIIGFPEDWGYVGGNSKAMLPGDNPNAHWACVAGDHRLGDQTPTIPASCPLRDADGHPYVLGMTVEFPSCWDGAGVGPNYTAHTVYAVPSDGDYPMVCPSGFASIIRMGVSVRYRLGQTCGAAPCFPVVDDAYNLTGATLASDGMDMGGGMTTGDHGVTAHADFLNGWTDAQLAKLRADCLTVDPHNCGIVVGKGQR